MLMQVLKGLDKEQGGKFFDYAGKEIPWWFIKSHTSSISPHTTLSETWYVSYSGCRGDGGVARTSAPVRWPHEWMRSLSRTLRMNKEPAACSEWNTDYFTHTIPNRLRMLTLSPFCPLVHAMRPDCLPSYLGSMQENSSSSSKLTRPLSVGLWLHPHLVYPFKRGRLLTYSTRWRLLLSSLLRSHWVLLLPLLVLTGECWRAFIAWLHDRQWAIEHRGKLQNRTKELRLVIVPVI